MSIDASDVAFVYWSGSRRRNEPNLPFSHQVWKEYADGFSDVGAHVVGISGHESKVKIDISKIIPSHIKYVIFQEIQWRHWPFWGQPILKESHILDDKICGLLTTDYWETAWSKSIAQWLDRYPAFKQFVITMHESAKEVFTTGRLPKKFIKLSQCYSKEYRRQRIIRTCNIFSRNILSSFSINEQEIIKHHKFYQEYDICLGGAVYKELYPFRYRICNVITKSRKFSVLDPPRGFDRRGYLHYYKSIACSRASISTGGLLNNSVKKYLEIPALKSCIIGGDTPVDLQFLNDVSLCLNTDLSDKEILNKVEDFLHNLPSINTASDYVLKYYNGKSVTTRMIEEIKNEKLS